MSKIIYTEYYSHSNVIIQIYNKHINLADCFLLKYNFNNYGSLILKQDLSLLHYRDLQIKITSNRQLILSEVEFYRGDLLKNIELNFKFKNITYDREKTKPNKLCM